MRITVTQEHFDRADRGGAAQERSTTCPNSLAVCEALGLSERGCLDVWTGTTSDVNVRGRSYYHSEIRKVQWAFDFGYEITLPVSYDLDLDAPGT